MNAIVYFEVQSANPENAITFYQALFGWRFRRDDQLPIPYWRIETGGIRGGLLPRPAATPPPECGTNAYVCSIEVSDIDAVADKILSLGGKVALPKFAVPGVC
jgi:predicted enzyme related to lactoylglutathione lyase